jgi:hypothetical protein
MNLSYSIDPIEIVPKSTLIRIESWFIPFDIVLIVLSIFSIVICVCILLIMIFDKTFYTVPMMLIGNLCLTVLMFSCGLLSYSIFTLENDLKQIESSDSYCIIRSFLTYGSGTTMDYSYLLQSIYRYVIVVYPNNLFLQSFRFQFLLICLTWIGGYVYLIPYVSTGQIVYNVDNQICQAGLRLSFPLMFLLVYAYIFPMLLVLLIYLKLFLVVKEMSKHVTPINTLVRARKQLKMVRRTVILIIPGMTVCFPYAIFIVISFFISPPKYHLRICYLFINVSVLLVMIAVFQFTESLKTSSMKKLKRRPNIVIPWIA